MKNKILITGTFCSGKTTLWNDLKDVLPDAIFIPEEAREIATLIQSIDWSQTAIRNYLIVRQIVVEEIAEKENKLIICDNGIHSNLAHDALLDAKINNLDLVKNLKHKQYDHIFYCDHSEIPIEKDNIRFTDIHLRSLIAEKIIEYLNTFNCKYTIIQGDRKTRAETVLAQIKS